MKSYGLSIMPEAGDGKIPVSDANGLVVWTTATGSGAPVRATSPTISGATLTAIPHVHTVAYNTAVVDSGIGFYDASMSSGIYHQTSNAGTAWNKAGINICGHGWNYTTEQKLNFLSWQDGEQHIADALVCGSIALRYNVDNYFNALGGNFGIGTASPDTLLHVNGAGHFQGQLTATSYATGSPAYEGDAVSELIKIKSDKGKLDHTSLPVFAQATFRKYKKPFDERFPESGSEEVIEPGQDLGAMISMLTVAIKQIDTRLKAIGG
jgi:hypothetical protein